MSDNSADVARETARGMNTVLRAFIDDLVKPSFLLAILLPVGSGIWWTSGLASDVSGLRREVADLRRESAGSSQVTTQLAVLTARFDDERKRKDEVTDRIVRTLDRVQQQLGQVLYQTVPLNPQRIPNSLTVPANPDLSVESIRFDAPLAP